MGFRFRKSINLGKGFRINFSKSGIGYSLGTKGYRITKTANGKIRQTFSIPGTGISYVEETGQTYSHQAQNQLSYKETVKRSFICGFILLAGLLVIGLIIGRLSAPSQGFITIQEYSQIREGMVYDRVEEIIGGWGELINRTEINDNTISVYVWYENETSNNYATITFENERVINKVQSGLE